MKAAAVHGIGLGFFFFIIYNAYALGMSFSVRGFVVYRGLNNYSILLRDYFDPGQ